MERSEVYELIDGEREYQEAMGRQYGWGEGQGASNHSVGDFLVMLKGYTDRAFDAWNKTVGGNEEALANVRKLAGIAVACMEKHGAPPRGLPPSEPKK